MSDSETRGVHWSFWIIGAVALIWNLMGAMNYVMQMNADAVASMPETHRVIIDGRPAWATGGFAIGVFGGAIGAFLLLLRKSAALHVFIVSLIGVIVTMIHTLGLHIAFGAFEMAMMVVMPFAVAVFLIWYSKRVKSQGWIK